MRELERQVLLQVIDRKWREHLYEMDYLQEGISLRAYAQRDPVVEYQREGFDMFNQMLEGIKEEAVGFLFNLEVEVRQAEQPAPATGAAVPRPGGAGARSRSGPRASAPPGRPPACSTPPPPSTARPVPARSPWSASRTAPPPRRSGWVRARGWAPVRR